MNQNSPSHPSDGPYGTGPYQQGGYPPPQPPRKNWFARHKVITVLGALILFGAVISVATGGGSDTASNSSDSASRSSDTANSSSPTAPTSGTSATGSAGPSAAAPRPGIGAPVRDGKFEFVVRGVREGGTSIGPDFMAERAQGRFVLVDLTVRNIGDEAQSLDVSSQKVMAADGTQFSPNTTATISIDDAAVFYEQINPGNALQVTVAYDVPDGVTPTSIEVHDSLFSGGATIDLR